MSPYLNLNTFAHVLVLVRDGFSVSGILFSLQRKQEVVLSFALLLLNLDLTAPEGITQGRKLRLTCWSNVNAIIVLKQNDTNTFIWWRTWILRCSRLKPFRREEMKIMFQRTWTIPNRRIPAGDRVSLSDLQRRDEVGTSLLVCSASTPLWTRRRDWLRVEYCRKQEIPVQKIMHVLKLGQKLYSTTGCYRHMVVYLKITYNLNQSKIIVWLFYYIKRNFGDFFTTVQKMRFNAANLITLIRS